MSTAARVIAAFMLVVGLSILAMVINFLIIQSPSVFRNALYLSPRSLILWLPVGVVGAAVFLLATRRTRRSYLVPCLVLLAVACLLWRLAPIANWLLPTATVK